MLCVWWGQKGSVYYELLKSGEAVDAARHRQQAIDLNPALITKLAEWTRRQGKVTPQKSYRKVKRIELRCVTSSIVFPDVALSDYHLFRSMAHELAGQNVAIFEEVNKVVDSLFASNDERFCRRGIHLLSERWENLWRGLADI